MANFLNDLFRMECRYNIDPLDFAWLQLMNRERAACGLKELSEEVLERVVDDLETRCHNNLQSSQLGIEYDEDTQCDVCLSVRGKRFRGL